MTTFEKRMGNKLISLLLMLVLLVSLSFSAVNVFADETQASQATTQNASDSSDEIHLYANSFQYRIETSGKEDCVCIVKYIGEGGDVSVPQTIDGLPVVVIGMEAFWYNDDLTAINLPQGLVYIEARAFQGCKNLQYVNIPDSVMEINVAAFEGCEKLDNLNVPDELLYIGGGAFDRTAWLKKYEGGSSVIFENKYFYRYDGDAEIVTIPDGITCISGNAFAGNQTLTYVHIPESVQFFGGFCFYNCPKLKSVSVPDNTAFIGDYAFGVDSLDKDGNPVYTEDFVLYANEGSYADEEYCTRFAVERKDRRLNATPDELPENEKGAEDIVINGEKKEVENLWVLLTIIIVCVVIVGGLYAYFTNKEKKEQEKKKAERKNKQNKKKSKKSKKK